MAKIRVGPREYELPEEFDLGELADMEEIAGQGYDMSKIGARGMVALAYVAVKRQDPRVTVADIRRMKIDDIEVVEEPGDDPDPPAPRPSDDEPEKSEPSEPASGNGSAETLVSLPPVTGHRV